MNIRCSVGRAALLLVGVTFVGLVGCSSDTPKDTANNSQRTTETSPANSSAARGSSRISNRELRDLQTLGYLAGYNAAESSKSGVVVNLKEAVAPGYTLFASGHSATAFLMNADGEVLHTWYAPFEKIFPEHVEEVKSRRGGRTTYWRQFELLPDGSLVIIFEGIGIAKLDKDSNVVWALLNGAHHDVDTRPDGSFLALSRDLREIGKGTYVNDCISIISAEGTELERISIVDAILKSPFETVIFRKGFRGRGDLLHTNSVQELPSGVPLPSGVSPGDYLISSRTTSTLAIISHTTKKVVWAFRGGFRTQHAASVGADGTLILFDNIGSGKRAGPSRILRYKLPLMKSVEKIETLEEGRTFFSRLLGAVSLLDNGNLLITSSEAGQILEITPQRKVVWEYRTPYRVGDKDEYVAVVSHARRYAVAFVNQWLSASASR